MFCFISAPCLLPVQVMSQRTSVALWWIAVLTSLTLTVCELTANISISIKFIHTELMLLEKIFALIIGLVIFTAILSSHSAKKITDLKTERAWND